MAVNDMEKMIAILESIADRFERHDFSKVDFPTLKEGMIQFLGFGNEFHNRGVVATGRMEKAVRGIVSGYIERHPEIVHECLGDFIEAALDKKTK
jgi:hypothetical protein